MLHLCDHITCFVHLFLTGVIKDLFDFLDILRYIQNKDRQTVDLLKLPFLGL